MVSHDTLKEPRFSPALCFKEALNNSNVVVGYLLQLWVLKATSIHTIFSCSLM